MLLRTLAWLTRRDGVVLLYHGVTRRTDGSYLKEADFAEQMEMLAAEFRVVGADEYLAAVAARRRLERGSVLVTFDDGFRNNYTIAAPIMRRLQLPWVLLSTSAGVAASGATLWMSMLRAVCRFAPEGTLSLLGTTWPLTDVTRRRVYKDMNRFVSRHEWARCRPAVWALIEEHQHHVPGGYVEEHCSLMNGDGNSRITRERPGRDRRTYRDASAPPNRVGRRARAGSAPSRGTCSQRPSAVEYGPSLTPRARTAAGKSNW